MAAEQLSIEGPKTADTVLGKLWRQKVDPDTLTSAEVEQHCAMSVLGMMNHVERSKVAILGAPMDMLVVYDDRDPLCKRHTILSRKETGSRYRVPGLTSLHRVTWTCQLQASIVVGERADFRVPHFSHSFNAADANLWEAFWELVWTSARRNAVSDTPQLGCGELNKKDQRASVVCRVIRGAVRPGNLLEHDMTFQPAYMEVPEASPPATKMELL